MPLLRDSLRLCADIWSGVRTLWPVPTLTPRCGPGLLKNRACTLLVHTHKGTAVYPILGRTYLLYLDHVDNISKSTCAYNSSSSAREPALLARKRKLKKSPSFPTVSGSSETTGMCVKVSHSGEDTRYGSRSISVTQRYQT